MYGACIPARPKGSFSKGDSPNRGNVAPATKGLPAGYGCPYGSQGEFHSKPYLDIVGEPLAGSLAPTLFSRPIVD